MKFNKVTDINGRVMYEIEDARWIWTNFSGAAKEFNAEGRRNFNLVLDEPIAQQLSEDGFNVKWHEPKSADYDGIWTLKVNVNMDSPYPPTIQMKNDHGIRTIDKENIAILDGSLMLESIFVKFSPFRFRENVSAYLQTLLVTVHESEYESRFHDEEDSFTNTMTFRAVRPQSTAELED